MLTSPKEQPDGSTYIKAEDFFVFDHYKTWTNILFNHISNHMKLPIKEYIIKFFTFSLSLVGVAGEQVQDDEVSLCVWEAQPGPRPQPHRNAGEWTINDEHEKRRYFWKVSLNQGSKTIA